MDIAILKERDTEHRVAVSPDTLGDFKALGVENIYVQSGAGDQAFFPDDMYRENGAEIESDPGKLVDADLFISLDLPQKELLDQMPEGKVLITQMNPLGRNEEVKDLCDKKLTCFSMDLVPRTTRAQSMDVLSSMATCAGYEAVLVAATNLPRFFPMFMTAAGTIAPAKVLVLGAGVAGLQAIATARRLGAVVEAFDVRSAVKEEVESLGAKFVEVEGAREDEAAGGYAVEQTEEYKEKQAQLIHDHAVRSDVIISTAQIPGKKAPVLIQEHTVKDMKPGSVIIDMAASTGGNCAVSENDKTVNKYGVTIVGESNLPAYIASDASKMFGRNVLQFIKLIIQEGKISLNWEDDIVNGTCVCHNGDIISPRLKSVQ